MSSDGRRRLAVTEDLARSLIVAARTDIVAFATKSLIGRLESAAVELNLTLEEPLMVTHFHRRWETDEDGERHLVSATEVDFDVLRVEVTGDAS